MNDDYIHIDQAREFAISHEQIECDDILGLMESSNLEELAAYQKKISELMDSIKMDYHRLRCFVDGDQLCIVKPGFLNLAVHDAIFIELSKDKLDAMEELKRNGKPRIT